MSERRTTRRDTLRFGGALAAGGLLAGCSDFAGQPGENGTPTGTGSYTVNMAPMGEVSFDEVPETWAAYDGGYADMAVALGQADGLTGVSYADRYFRYVYDELPGVSVDEETLSAHPEVRTKEEFYALDSDVHLYDPQMLVNWFDWSEDDVEEIRTNVAPFVGNLIFRRSDDWHDYEYYTLYEAFETVAQVFQQQARYEAFRDLHDEFIASIRDRLPPESERPTVFLTYEGTDEPSTFSLYRLDDAGTSKKQWRDLGVTDALAETDIDQLSSTERSELDYENLLEIDPEVVLIRGHERKSPAEFRDTVLGYMQEHPVGSELTAVQNGRVYRGGFLNQGPIQNLFLTERATQQLFPDEFGAVTSDRELFDRQRVVDIVNDDS
ncbi:ABC transporter substrate-binding protein [Haloarcula sediminis]|uniref:ABC transporter substrate-binding protein n=1 Tax=Haloarcula sediminis TaxID=3111777 RepID=UPI002D786F87|nr:ABC transporter substrate-binding protein [Haloarcula sp. CK38]